MLNIDNKYKESLDFLYSFIDFSLKRNLRYSPDKFNLNRMHDFMALLGNPQEDYKIIHVAGTKGKGSVSSLCANVLVAQGYKTGLYTSPHMSNFSERIQVNGENISKKDLIDIVDSFRVLIDKVPEITTFELTTALAFVNFSRRNVDFAVIEVGLGGRLDATNIVNPIVSVITSISYDHMSILGNTLSEIAGEKGGIIKPHTPVVVSPQKKETQLKLTEIADEKNAPIIQVGRDYLYAADSHNLDGQSFYVWTPDEQPLTDKFIESGGRDVWSPLRFHIPLVGLHQVENAATAYAALKTVEKLGVKIDQSSYEKGFSTVKWPGRMEILHTHPTLIIDSAHNRYSAMRLHQAMDDYFPGLPILLVFGASEDKDIDGMFEELLPRMWRIIATQSTHPRSMEAETLVEMAQKFGRLAQAVVPIEDALSTAIQEAGQEAVVLVTGSVFVAAAAREIYFKMNQRSPKK